MKVRELLDATAGVTGWLFPIDAHLFFLVDAIQKQAGVRGNLFEIGVHHGKTAIMLAHMAAPGEIVGVCDVFDRQDLNADHSGAGNRRIFEDNMRRFATMENVRVFAKLSAGLTGDETTTSCRFFHIDGGHRPQDVFSDLETAARALLPHGVVAVDDVFHPSWPGVGEGLYRYLAARAGVFVPIAIGGNKVFFTRPEGASLYRIRELPPELPFDVETKEWLGREVMVAGRRSWVDLDPLRTAREHFVPRTWRERLLHRLLC